MISRDFRTAARALGAVLILTAACTPETPPRPAPIRFEIAIPDSRTLGGFALSPDGAWLVYSAESGADRTRRLFVRSLGEATAPDRELAGTAGAVNPFLSPDGAQVAFFSRGGLWSTGADGRSEPRRIADAPADSAGGTWTADGRIVFAPLGRQGLMQVTSSGGAAVPLTRLVPSERELSHEWPHVLPSGGIAFTVSQRGRDPHLEVLSPEGERIRLKVPIVGPAQFVASGHFAYGYLGNLMAVRFDQAAIEISGIPQVIAKGLNRFSASRSGTLAWLRSSAEDAKSHLVRVRPDGAYERLAAPAEVYQTPRLSPDGRRLAVVVRPDFMTREIRVLDSGRPDRLLFTVSGGDNQSPAWMDNRRLTFGSNRDGLQRIYVVGSDPKRAQPLFTATVAVARNPAVWSKPPRLLALYEIEPARGRDVFLYRVGESIAPIAAGEANERSPALSPDGRWIAFVSDVSGRDEVYVKPLDESMEAMQLTSSGAVEPVWTREGLFYREGDAMVLADLRSGVPGTLRKVFEGDFERDPGANLPAYDVDSQGNFIMLKSARQPRSLRIVRNWDSELLAQLPLR